MKVPSSIFPLVWPTELYIRSYLRFHFLINFSIYDINSLTDTYVCSNIIPSARKRLIHFLINGTSVLFIVNTTDYNICLLYSIVCLDDTNICL